MPPKAKITREMVIDAALALTRTAGAASINARAVAQQLGCSTQPVMYHFAKVEDLKRAVYEKADRLHTEYLLRTGAQENAMLGIGLNYIRFAAEEAQLFRFLFQSGFARGNSVPQMLDSEALTPILGAMQAATGLEPGQTKELFFTLALFAHGYASIIANHAFEFQEDVVAAHLERACRGAILSIREGTK